MSEIDPATLNRRKELLESFRPMDMSDCWWVAARYSDDSIQLQSHHLTELLAREHMAEVQRQAANWLHQPSEITVLKEASELSAARRWGGWPPDVARWNWLDRHAERLLSAAEPRPALVLRFDAEATATEETTDLAQHRIGGRAVLPSGVEWPEFDLPPQHPEFLAISRRLGTSHRESPYPGGTVYGTYLRTIDLRSKTEVGPEFPDAISLFICTFNEEDETYEEWYTNLLPDPQAVAVPLHLDDQLELRDPPQNVPKLETRNVQVRTLPDFPGYGWGQQRKLIEPSGLRALIPFKRPQFEWISGPMEEVYAAIEEAEPGTDGWINVDCSKVRGYPTFIQNDLLEVVQMNEPDRDWQVVASVNGDILDVGDGGKIYVLAGQHREKRDWKWHCEMQCY